MEMIYNNRVSNKYHHLKELSKIAAVPAMYLLTEEQISQYINSFETIKNELHKVEDNIRLTAGAFLTDDLRDINTILSRLEWTTDSIELLNYVKEQFVSIEGNLYAIRSAANMEDLSGNSFAGIYDSKLSISLIEPEQFLTAVLDVWKSGYSSQAIIERLQIPSENIPSFGFEMNILIQVMVKAKLAGVALNHHPLNISGDEKPYIECVKGLGEGLVSGEKNSLIFDEETWENEYSGVFEDLCYLVKVSQKYLQSNVDIEWAYDGNTTWLLQARALNDSSENICDAQQEALLTVHNLYGDLSNISIPKRQLPVFAISFNAKRRPLFESVQGTGALLPSALIVELNRKSLFDQHYTNHLIKQFTFDEVVVDFSKNVRQLIVPLKDLIIKLQSLLTEEDKSYVIVIRDFIYGDLGVITRTHQQESVLVEFSSDGLLAMNRGSAVTNTTVITSSLNEGLKNHLPVDVLFPATLQANKFLGCIQVEWVISQGKAYIIDFSNVNSESSSISLSDADVISAGYAMGEAFRIPTDSVLEKLSIAPLMSVSEDIPDISIYGNYFVDLIREIEAKKIKPIFIAERPYAVLASLIPYCSGFIFSKGGLLSHLGIILREKGIPAVCNQNTFNTINNSDLIEINTENKEKLTVVRK